MAYYLLATNTVTGSSTAYVEFANITDTFRDLELRMSAKSTATIDIGYIYLNGDTSSSGYTGLYMDTGNTGSARSGSFDAAGPYEYGNVSYPNQYVASRTIFSNYAKSTDSKGWFTDTYLSGSQSGTYNAFTMGRARSTLTSAITSIRIYGRSGNIDVGSTFSLYGII